MKISFLKIIFTAIFFLSPFVVFAGTEHNMSGYAWSSNIGWISFNCTNDNSCGASNYGVNNDTSGNLSGYAWSSNIGWIKFGGLSGWPSGSGTIASNAKITNNSLRGWAKALSADGNGWDGWISLSGIGYGVTFASDQSAETSMGIFRKAYALAPGGKTIIGTLNGYAWGSDVVGWINFDVVGPASVIVGPGGSGTCTDGIKNGNETTVDFGGRCAGGWSGWGACSVSCGQGGTQTRTCTNPIPSGSGPGCNGPSSQLCNTQPCVGATGACSFPANHLTPCTSGTPSSIASGPNKWTWTCSGSNPDPTVTTDDASCSENKPTIFVEPE